METREQILDRITLNGKYSIDKNIKYGLDYHQREKLKHEASVVFHGDFDVPTRATALLYWCESHYWRAKEDLEGCTKAVQRKVHGKRYMPGYELELEVYTRHWLWALGSKLAGDDILNYISDTYGFTPEKSKFLEKGKTIYSVRYSLASD